MSNPLHALRRAIAAVKAGDKVAGRRLLAEVIRDDPRNETAWLWMSAALDSDQQRRTCLERVLAINPGNATAQQGLARLGSTLQPPALSSPGTPPEPAALLAEPALPKARQALPSVGQAHRARVVLPGWSLLIALGATIVVCATVGIAAYLALSGAVGAMRQLVRRAGRRAATAEIMDE